MAEKLVQPTNLFQAVRVHKLHTSTWQKELMLALGTRYALLHSYTTQNKGLSPYNFHLSDDHLDEVRWEYDQQARLSVVTAGKTCAVGESNPDLILGRDES